MSRVFAHDGVLTAVPVNAAATFESGRPQGLFQTRVPFPGSVYRSDYEVVGATTAGFSSTRSWMARRPHQSRSS